MPDVLLLALLLAAVAIGWWLGRRERRGTSATGSSPTLARDYFVGLNYLLNDQQDRAIETFIGALEVNSDTIETHIALGNLFRSRGEADRAVKVHQNLLARPTLSGNQGDRVQLELSRDFLHLGLLDRAERLLQGLIKEAHDDELCQSAKRLLVDLLEREGEWQAALDVALPSLVRQHEDIRRAAAHWLCELADQERHSASPVLARRHLKQALSTDGRCVRANLLLAEMALDTGQYRPAIRFLSRIPDQDKAFVPTMLEPLSRAYRLLDDETGLIRQLESLLDQAPYTSVIILLAESLRRHHGDAHAALELVGQQLNREPSLGAVDYLMRLYRQDTDTDDERIELLQHHTDTLLKALPRHRCRRCGFSGEQLHWQCPRCRSWGTTKPITGIEGE
ncbi:lipopolysaccharide assembly protein LapB [Halomonas elongata]|uniref:Lipopolysaccharide assembly protein B n=2 Tax=Halomonas elongata TaxID=2746 RepID=E1V3S4_HALED|nr:lipopolysaccharide assembly protein LapB [Halomonas elongata]MBW5801770.1 lipopolysaccharide assembly protein LapB [Halomonas elongata]MDL4862287.1 lipopolysaccharide assembly protein LapB [Halomonas elongata]WBF16483.1 lipopolysaccharide assembly protein LapB [Halomonas elongata]WPU48924.1 lipopolysaccharide assembly protein LapB [Halomonas elongata DSM 2581]WVI70188.1 lipopolysaccharide assembly protein LapB [Halomonas elongata]